MPGKLDEPITFGHLYYCMSTMMGGFSLMLFATGADTRVTNASLVVFSVFVTVALVMKFQDWFAYDPPIPGASDEKTATGERYKSPSATSTKVGSS